MGITNEIKARVFAQYLGCGVEIKTDKKERAILGVVGFKEPERVILRFPDDETPEWSYADLDEFYLILRPLSEITDEDAIEVAKIIDSDAKDIYASEGTVHWTYEMFDEEFENCIDFYSFPPIVAPIALFQYLQSRGYDLPHYLLGGKTLKEAGLAIYE